MAGNPIQYTSRTFNTILADINSVPELADKPDWFKILVAGVGDAISVWNNATTNDNFLRTSFTRQSVADLLELIDYQLTPHTTAQGEQLFHLSRTVVFPVTISVDDIVAQISGATNISFRRFEARSGITISSQETETLANTAADDSTDIITVTRVYTTGEIIQITSSDPPAGLSVSTDYYVIKVSDTQIRLATTQANAFAGTYVDITAQGSSNFTLNIFSFKATVYQQETKDQQNIGTSDGVTEFQEFDLPELDILKDTLVITVNSQTYTRVDTLAYSQPTDRHFVLFYKTDNSSAIRFGNDTYGAIPPAFDVLADYAVGGGANSNVASANRITVYGGSSSDITGTTNPAAITGGANPQSIESGKILGPLLLKTRDRFVTTEDGKALVEAFGGTSQSRINKNAFGVLSAQVITIANGGGNPSTSFKTDLQEHLIERTVLEGIDTRVEDTTITSYNVTSAAKMLDGYLFANVLPYFRLAWKLFLNEAAKEIQDDYTENGIETATVLINTILSESFGSADYGQISIMLDRLIPSLIGDEKQNSDAFAFIQGSVEGIDSMTITAPSFPITNANDEITTDGTLTLTEIP